MPGAAGKKRILKSNKETRKKWKRGFKYRDVAEIHEELVEKIGEKKAEKLIKEKKFTEALLKKERGETRAAKWEKELEKEGKEYIEKVRGLLQKEGEEEAGHRRWASGKAIDLADKGSKELLPLLEKALLEDTDVDVKINSARAIGVTGLKSSISVLEKALEDDNTRVRAMVGTALKRIGIDHKELEKMRKEAEKKRKINIFDR